MTEHGATALDSIDRRIINALQEGLPISPHPYAEAARALDLEEDELIERLTTLLGNGVLSRFGPMYNVERMGGKMTLAAMKVSEEDFDAVSNIVNSFPEVAHNYARNHVFNMWFVIACESQDRIPEVIRMIEEKSGCKVYDMPKSEEFYVGLRFQL